MASNYAPLTQTEKDQLKTQPNVDMILAWALVKGIVRHPEVLQQIQLKTIEVSAVKNCEGVNNEKHIALTF